jgi:hypothetical protein
MGICLLMHASDCAANLVPDSEAFLGGPAGQKITTALAQAGDTQSEDCLTVNVWTKPQTGEAAKAVLFWIYGGGTSLLSTIPIPLTSFLRILYRQHREPHL